MRLPFVVTGALAVSAPRVALAESAAEQWISEHPDLFVGVCVAILVALIVLAIIVSNKVKAKQRQQGAAAHSASGTPYQAPKRFVSLGSGLVFFGPNSWEDRSDEALFRVWDPVTETQFTSSAYENPGWTIEQWAQGRFDSVAKGMPYFRQVKPPYDVATQAGRAIASEYRGTPPNSKGVTHYFVLCLLNPEKMISFTITADADQFVKNEALYRWLLANKLDIYKVERVQV